MLSVVADVGGTNIRLAVCCDKTGSLSQIRTFTCSEFLTLDAALFQYFSTLSEKVNSLCLAIACPVDDDLVSMTNLSWQFSKTALKTKLGLAHLFVINDYTGIALAVPFLSEQEKVKIGGGEAQKHAVTAIFGPGTGLGVAHLMFIDNKWISLDGEGGHSSFAANSREQTDILLLLQEQFGHVSAERLLSGQGLVNIYHAICRLEGKQVEFHEPKQVTEGALNGHGGGNVGTSGGWEIVFIYENMRKSAKTYIIFLWNQLEILYIVQGEPKHDSPCDMICIHGRISFAVMNFPKYE